MINQEIANILFEIGYFLEMEEAAFRPQAYERAAIVLENLKTPVDKVYEKGGVKALIDLPGIGENIAKLHNHDLIHGDITTSNMILYNDRIHFIDFGLGEKNPELELKGVDLHVLMEAIESTHLKYSKCFKYVLDGYKKELKTDARQVIKKIDEIVKRGRYR